MDQATPIVLYETSVQGKQRKALAVLRTDGYLFQLDRETSKPIFPAEERPVKQDARQKTSPTQPFPVGADRLGPECMDPEVLPLGFVPGCWFELWYYDHPNVVSPGITTTTVAAQPDAGNGRSQFPPACASFRDGAVILNYL